MTAPRQIGANRALTVCACLAMAIGQSWALSAESSRPNLILILADDLGYSDVRCFQALHTDPAGCDAKTPHIDSIARSGVLLTDFYAHPVCTPSRYCLLTGFHLGRSQDLRDINVLDYDYPNQGIRAHENTIAEVYQDAGYATSVIGKWHLGSGQMVVKVPPKLPFSKINIFHPNAHGFEYYYGFLGGSIDYCTHEKRALFFDWYENRDLLFVNGGKGKNEHADQGKYATQLISDKAVERIHQHAAAKTPFFMYIPYVAPHWAQTAIQEPLAVHQLPNEEEDPTSPHYRRYLQQFDDVYPGGDKTNWRKRLLAMVKAMDEGIGRILQALRQHDLEENTIVLFTSDNGGETEYGQWLNRSIPYGSNNHPFTRGDKGTVFEGGVRVPAMIQWKGQIRAGQISHQIASVVDLKLSLGRLAGLNMDAYPTDGIDLSSNFCDAQTIVERDLFLHNTWRGRLLRQGKWKYVRNHRGETAGQDELYDLKADPGETKNLAAIYPKKLAMLKALHDRKHAQVRRSEK